MKHEPKFSYTWPTSHVWLAVTEALSATPVADISCSLTALEGAVSCTTVKILKFGTPQTIAIIVLKIEKFDVTLH